MAMRKFGYLWNCTMLYTYNNLYSLRNQLLSVHIIMFISSPNSWYKAIMSIRPSFLVLKSTQLKSWVWQLDDSDIGSKCSRCTKKAIFLSCGGSICATLLSSQIVDILCLMNGIGAFLNFYGMICGLFIMGLRLYFGVCGVFNLLCYEAHYITIRYYLGYSFWKDFYAFVSNQ